MRDDHPRIQASADVPHSAPTAPARRPASQLLIEMPQEAAARLLVRSLLEHVSLLAAPGTVADDATISVTRPAGWRSATHRLDACLSLYAPALTDSIPRKARRRVRELSRRAERRHRAEVQVAWLGQFLQGRARVDADMFADLRDDVAAAAWLSQRVLRRQPSTSVSLKRANRDANKLHALAKSLSVYTTAVKVDDMPRSQSFSLLTQALLRADATLLWENLHEVRASDLRAARRALNATRRLSYVLEPVRVHMTGVAGIVDRLSELQASLERLAGLAALASVILRAGRRAGSLHMTTMVRAELFGRPQPSAAGYAPPPRDLRRGVLMLARHLRAEISPAFDRFSRQWSEEKVGALSADLESCAAQLPS